MAKWWPWAHHDNEPVPAPRIAARNSVSPLRISATNRSFVMDLSSLQTFITTTAVELGIKVLAAIAFWIVGRWLIGRVVALMQNGMNRSSVDPTLTKYLGS